MKLRLEIMKMLYSKIIYKKNNGEIIKEFVEKMGIVYIKLAQTLATQNYGNLFTEDDRKALSEICDNYNPIPYKEIKKILKKEYGKKLDSIFEKIEEKPTGSASISQVHKGILKNGEMVAIKIKRKDITAKMDKEIKRIKTLIHRYGKLFNFGNFKGADLALDLYLGWIKQEIDFKNEKENIKIYSKYAKSVNHKIKETKELKVPKIYEEYCTDNVIVMEYIEHQTINQIKLTGENKDRIKNAINSYIKLNFWAMFNDKPIAFHGDPHSANLAIDKEGNLYFLDMGLIFVLNSEESKLCRDFFLTIYSGNYEKLYNMLVIYGDMTNEMKKTFKEDCKKYIEEVKDKNVTHYFIDLINICLSFNFVPPTFLFNMGKAFICIYGICSFSENNINTKELLENQIIEFTIKKKTDDFKNTIINNLNKTSKIVEEIIINNFSEISQIIYNDFIKNIEDTLNLIKIYKD